MKPLSRTLFVIVALIVLLFVLAPALRTAELTPAGMAPIRGVQVYLD